MAESKSRIVVELGAQDTSQKAFNSFNRSVKRTQQEVAASNKHFRQWRGMMGQMGHQVQDVAVQMQSGTAAAIIFAQQGGQIASLIGPWGAVAGAAIAIGGALASALGVMSNTKDALNDLEKAQSAVNKILKEGKIGAFQLSEEYERLFETASAVAGVQLESAMEQSENAIVSANKQIMKSLGDAGSAIRALRRYKSLYSDDLTSKEKSELMKRTVDATAQAIKSVRSEFDLTYDKSRELVRALKELEDTKTAEEFNKWLGVIRDIAVGNEGLTKAISGLNEVIAASHEARKELAALKGVSEDFGKVDPGLQRALDMQTKAIQEAVVKGQQARKQATVDANIGYLALQNAHYAIIRENEASFQQQQIDDMALWLQKQSAVGEAAANELYQRTVVENMGYLHLQKAHYGIIQSDKEAHDTEMLRLTELYWRKNAAIANIARQGQVVATKQQLSDALSFASSAVGQIGDILAEGGEQNKAAFLAQKAFNIASIIANTEMAATASGAQAAVFAGAPGWFTISNMVRASGYAAAGAVAGQTLASFEGGGITFDGIRAGGLDGKGGKLAVVHPNEKITDMEKEGEGKAVNVNFNIYAWDTETGAEQIQKQRGTIISMLNRAMNNQGQRGQFR